jgi:hypothetical protein
VVVLESIAGSSATVSFELQLVIPTPATIIPTTRTKLNFFILFPPEMPDMGLGSLVCTLDANAHGVGDISRRTRTKSGRIHKERG